MEALKIKPEDCLLIPRNYRGGSTILKVVGYTTGDGNTVKCESWSCFSSSGKFTRPERRLTQWTLAELEGLESRGHLERLEPAEVPPEVR